jgi:protein TonB
MRLVSFLVLSLALHAVALAFPVPFGGKSAVEVMYVTIMPMEQESIGRGGPGASGSAATGAILKSPMRRPRSGPPEVESQPNKDPQPQATPVEAAAKADDSNLGLVSAAANSAESERAAILDSRRNSGYGSGSAIAGVGSASDSSRASGIGSESPGGSGIAGTGSGSGNGQSSSDNGILSQARYRETPRPDYPESARREGREGRVLLRVLVDDQGRSKHVEINSSSGSDVLDRAAAEAIRRWRFHPARHGEQPIESWLRIPIEFRLADARSQ